MSSAVDKLKALPGLIVPPGTPGLYVSLLRSLEVKAGMSQDITVRHEDKEFGGAKILAILPGWRGVESDIHNRFRPLRSRQDGDPNFRETYWPNAEMVNFILAARAMGFTPDQLRRFNLQGIALELRFDDGQRLKLELTYLHVIEPGHLLPRYVLDRTCPTCEQPRNSLEFLNAYTVEMLGQRKTKSEYMVLHSTDICAVCCPRIFPANVAFGQGQTRIRLGTLRSSSGDIVLGYDRDYNCWRDLKDFGVRRMAKKPRPGHKNDVGTLRLQPSTARDGKAQGTA